MKPKRASAACAGGGFAAVEGSADDASTSWWMCVWLGKLLLYKAFGDTHPKVVAPSIDPGPRVFPARRPSPLRTTISFSFPSFPAPLATTPRAAPLISRSRTAGVGEPLAIAAARRGLLCLHRRPPAAVSRDPRPCGPPQLALNVDNWKIEAAADGGCDAPNEELSLSSKKGQRCGRCCGCGRVTTRKTDEKSLPRPGSGKP